MFYAAKSRHARRETRLWYGTNLDDDIVKTPGVCGGKPRMARHRLRVQDMVVLHEQQGQSPDEIVSAYPQVSLAQVSAALVYDHEHREAIRRDLAEDDAFVEALNMAYIAVKVHLSNITSTFYLPVQCGTRLRSWWRILQEITSFLPPSPGILF
jgi:uncharacterized protein (DUF433 family)